jgi:hypothetical protein
MKSETEGKTRQAGCRVAKLRDLVRGCLFWYECGRFCSGRRRTNGEGDFCPAVCKADSRTPTWQLCPAILWLLALDLPLCCLTVSIKHGGQATVIDAAGVFAIVLVGDRFRHDRSHPFGDDCDLVACLSSSGHRRRPRNCSTSLNGFWSGWILVFHRRELSVNQPSAMALPPPCNTIRMFVALDPSIPTRRLRHHSVRPMNPRPAHCSQASREMPRRPRNWGEEGARGPVPHHSPRRCCSCPWCRCTAGTLRERQRREDSNRLLEVF